MQSFLKRQVTAFQVKKFSENAKDEREMLKERKEKESKAKSVFRIDDEWTKK